MKRKLCIALCALSALLTFGCGAAEGPEAGPPPQMHPTQAGLTGVFDAYLYLPLEGGTYRYEHMGEPEKDETAGELIFTFVEDTGFDKYDWKVYTVKKYPSYSHVLAQCGTHYAGIYRYCPPKRSDEGALERAREQGCVIMEDGDVTSGQDVWDAFVAETEKGNPASVRTAHYHTLDPERCDPVYYAAYKEDYPVLYIDELEYDGEKFTLRLNQHGEKLEKTYAFLKRYEGELPAQASYDSYVRYVLTNDDTVTWERLERGMLSSQFGDYIDHVTIYTDLQSEG